jgi:hypothetical protein
VINEIGYDPVSDGLIAEGNDVSLETNGLPDGIDVHMTIRTTEADSFERYFYLGK